jgi:hypothetical protein
MGLGLEAVSHPDPELARMFVHDQLAGQVSCVQGEHARGTDDVVVEVVALRADRGVVAFARRGNELKGYGPHRRREYDHPRHTDAPRAHVGARPNRIPIGAVQRQPMR